MTEALIAVIASLAAGSLVRALRRRDPVVGGRVARLRDRPGSQSARRREVARALAWVGRRVPGDRDAVARSLDAAGIGTFSPDVLLGARVGGLALGVVLGIQAGSLAPIAAGALGLIGYKLPGLLVTARIRSRRDEVAAALPDAVDLLAVCTAAGLNVPLALVRVAEGTPGVLGEELRRTVREIDLGVPRQRALGDLAARNEAEDLAALVAALVSAERFGTRLVASLESFAGELRLTRRRRAEEQARRAPVKILFPLVFLILPAFILLTVVPLLLGTFQTLGF